MHRLVHRQIRCTGRLLIIGILTFTGGRPQVACGGGPYFVAARAPVLLPKKPGGIGYSIHIRNLGEPEVNLYADRVNKAFLTWGSVPTTALRFFQERPQLYAAPLSLKDYGLIERGTPKVGNVVFVDPDASLIAELMGEANRTKVLGWGIPVVDAKEIVRFIAVINTCKEVLPAVQHSCLLHEVGHAIGLDHSQITAAFSPGNGRDSDFTPVMYPLSRLPGDPQLDRLRPDDQAWVSHLYPSAAYPKEYGQLKGEIVANKDGNRILVRGANIVAVRKNDPTIRVSCVSDYLNKGDGSFELPLKAGSYTVYVEPIQDRFFGSSRVGIHAETREGFAFQHRVKPQLFPLVPYDIVAGKTTNAGNIQVELQQQ